MPSRSLEDQFAERVDQNLDPMAQGIADHLGPAPGAERYSQREIDDLWDTPDTGLDSQQLFAALQQGITDQGAERVALLRMSPELRQHVVGTPQPPDAAAAIAKLAQYPGRYVVTTDHSTDPEEQVKYVAKMQQRAAGRRAQQAAPPLAGGQPP